MMLPPSSLVYPSEIDCRSPSANGGRNEYIDSTSAMSVRGLCLNRLSREARLGNNTLSSLALPILVVGSSCSRSMLNRADIPGMISDVRKLLASGSAAMISSDEICGGAAFCFRFKLLNPGIPLPPSVTPSLAFFLLLKTFIVRYFSSKSHQRLIFVMRLPAVSCIYLMMTHQSTNTTAPAILSVGNELDVRLM